MFPIGARAVLAVVLGLLGLGLAAALPTCAAAAPFKYVALGDSFSAGEGVDPYFRDGYDSKKKKQTGKKDNRCHRSTRAYAEYVQPPGYSAPLYELASTGKPGKGKRANKYKSDANVRANGDVTWALLACSGAKSVNVLPAALGGKAKHQDETPQLDWSTIDNTTSVVTITIGGNDADFAKIARRCATTACNTDSYRKEIDQAVSDAATAAGKVYGAVRSEAPNARVLVLGYPHLFPASEAEQKCTELRPWRGEQDMLRARIATFNALLAAKAADQGFEFVDLAGRFAQHEVCGDKGAWINGPSTTGKLGRRFVDDETFHPRLEGQKDMAAAVNTLLAKPQPTPPPTPQPTPLAPAPAPASSKNRLIFVMDGYIASAPLPALTPVTRHVFVGTEGNEISGLAADRERVYWSLYYGAKEGIYSAALSGGDIRHLATVDGPKGGVLAGGRYFWSSDDAIGWYDTRTGAVMPKAIPLPHAAESDGYSVAVDLAADSDYLYVASCADKAISRVRLDGTELIRRFAPTGVCTTDVAVNNSGLFYIGDDEESIGRLRLDGSGLISDWVEPGGADLGPYGLEATSGFLYYYTRGSTSLPGPAYVGRVSMDLTEVNPTFLAGAAFYETGFGE